MFLAEKGIAIAPVPVDLAKGEQHSDAYRAINPRQVVPTLVLEDGTAIGEAPAIWRYLEEVHRAGAAGIDRRTRHSSCGNGAELEGFAAVMEGAQRGGTPQRPRDCWTP
jgi:glutathione S-transferase